MTSSKKTNFSETFYNAITILLFLCAIAIPAIGHMSGSFDIKYIYETEKRAPNPLPDFSDNFKAFRSYPGQISAYLNDYFGFRSHLVSMNNLLYLMLGSSTSTKVIKGKSGWLFYTEGDMINQYRGVNRYSEKELDRWITAMEERQSWLAKEGIPFIIAVPPNKMTIYSEYLPDWVSKVVPQTRIDQIVSVLSDSSLDFIDLRPALFEAKKKNTVYYMTDSHWNYHAGFIGYTEIMKAVKKYFPGTVVLSSEDVDILYQESSGKDLCNLLNISDYKKELFADKVFLKKPSNIIATKFLSQAHFPKQVTTKIEEMTRVLIFGDSYTINLEPFFDETFKEVLYTDYDSMKFDTAIIKEYKPDLVLHIMVERQLRYRPFNPGDVGDGRLRISNWGPDTVQMGKKFNIQPNGMSAFYLIGENISKNTVIIWNQTQLKTSVNLEKSVLSAYVSDNLYAFPGKYEIKLYDPPRNEYSDGVFFEVTD